MSEQTQELVTKIDIQPDIAGLINFQQEIDRATSKVKQLDAAIRKANELHPKSRYAPPVNNPGATAAAAGLSAGLGANLVTRTTLGPIVKKAAQDTAKKATEVAAGGVNLALEDMRGRMTSGRGLGPFLGGGVGAHNAGNLASGGGRGGGLINRPGAFDGMNFNANNFDGVPMGKKPVAEAVSKATGKGFKMPDMMAGAAAAIGLSMGLNAVADSMDKIQSQEAQLERLPQTLGSGKDAYIELNKAATDVRTGGDAFISTYTNMATATEKLGLSQKETTKAAQGMVSALQLGGGSKQAIDNATYQMGQAFSSDRFGGDEFRSFMEAIGTQAPAVAKAFGTDVKGLRAMSEEGKLTAETMVKAFEKMADQNIELLNKQGWTWGQVTTVMKNDWSSFLATATEGGEWNRLMTYVANEILPGFRTAEEVVAKFWASTTDESKANILLGILAALGAGFAALAIPVLAATWPFLAIGAAVWLALEVFTEFKHWMDGKGGTIFDSLFGSFDEFEKRYPHIISMLRNINKLMGNVDDFSGWLHQKTIGKLTGEQQEKPEEGGLFNGLNNAFDAGKSIGKAAEGGSGPLSWLENLLSIPQQLKELPLLPPALTQGGAQATISNTNSGNTTIQVATPEEAATVANQRDAAFITQYGGGGLDNMAEAGGYV